VCVCVCVCGRSRGETVIREGDMERERECVL
jgi:hypothetical protein